MELEKGPLQEWRSKLADEIAELENKLDLTKVNLEKKREKFKALEVLLGPGGTDVPPLDDVERSGMSVRAVSSNGRALITPADTYWVPILEALVERGGREQSSIILDMVAKKMEHILTPADHEVLASGVSPRWRNRAQWQRQNMVQQGLMSRNCPHGVWEITKVGREWLNQPRGRR